MIFFVTRLSASDKSMSPDIAKEKFDKINYFFPNPQLLYHILQKMDAGFMIHDELENTEFCIPFCEFKGLWNGFSQENKNYFLQKENWNPWVLAPINTEANSVIQDLIDSIGALGTEVWLKKRNAAL